MKEDVTSWQRELLMTLVSPLFLLAPGRTQKQDQAAPSCQAVQHLKTSPRQWGELGRTYTRNKWQTVSFTSGFWTRPELSNLLQ